MDQRRATLVVDLGFGDAGKGTVVDTLARHDPNTVVVRFNGGPQAAHNVITPEGRHHTFAQFGSGTFVPGVRTHLSRFMLIEPMAMTAEAQHLQQLGCGNVFSRLTVDEHALVITPYMRAANHLREMFRGDDRHGSCGLGIGETMSHVLHHQDEAIFAGDLRDRNALRRKLRSQQDRLHDEFATHLDDLLHMTNVSFDAVELSDPSSPPRYAVALSRLAQSFTIVDDRYLRRLAQRHSLIFEGAQGVLIDEAHGFHPYTTWSTTTFANADTILREIGYVEAVQRLGVLRTYAVRHGPGPFPTEDAELYQVFDEPHNNTGRWQGSFRTGWFDDVLTQYAIDACHGVDGFSITHLDRLPRLEHHRTATSYRTAEGASIERLRPTFDRDLAWQERLTRRLMTCRPVYEPLPTDPQQFLHQLSERFGVPTVLASFGPTAVDKHFIGISTACT